MIKNYYKAKVGAAEADFDTKAEAVAWALENIKANNLPQRFQIYFVSITFFEVTASET